MTLKPPDIKYKYINSRYRADMGYFMTILERRLIGKRFLILNKYSRTLRYFWRPSQRLVSSHLLKYIEYGNNRRFLCNMWYEILYEIGSPPFLYGFPDIDKIHLYPLKKIRFRGKLHGELMKFFSLNYKPF